MSIERQAPGEESGYDCEVVTATTISADYTPADQAGNAVIVRGIAFGTAGALKYITPQGRTVTIPSGVLAAGFIHPIKAIKLIASGSTVAGGVCVWS